jgi:hypothetical protein
VGWRVGWGRGREVLIVGPRCRATLMESEPAITQFRKETMLNTLWAALPTPAIPLGFAACRLTDALLSLSMWESTRPWRWLPIITARSWPTCSSSP